MSKNDESGEPKPIYKKIWFWMLSALIVLTTVGIFRGPSGNQEINYKQAGVSPPSSNGATEPAPVKQAAVAPTDQPVTCDSPEAAQMVKSALEGSSNALQQVEVLDFGQVSETFADRVRRIRGCKAIAELSTGGGLVAFQLYFGPSGRALVQVEQGIKAQMRLDVDEDEKKAIAERDAQPAAQPGPTDQSGEPMPRASDADDGNAPQEKSQ